LPKDSSYNLVKDGSVRAEERVLGQTALTIGGTDVENLALGIRVGVVTSVHLACAREPGFGDLGVNGVVLTRNTGNSLLEHGNVVTSSSTFKQINL
jgi:hypothetical protein